MYTKHRTVYCKGKKNWSWFPRCSWTRLDWGSIGEASGKSVSLFKQSLWTLMRRKWIEVQPVERAMQWERSRFGLCPTTLKPQHTQSDHFQFGVKVRSKRWPWSSWGLPVIWGLQTLSHKVLMHTSRSTSAWQKKITNECPPHKKVSGECSPSSDWLLAHEDPESFAFS